MLPVWGNPVTRWGTVLQLLSPLTSEQEHVVAPVTLVWRWERQVRLSPQSTSEQGACVGPAVSCHELGLGAQVTVTGIEAGSCVGEAACLQAAKASTATGVLTVAADTSKADNECAECGVCIRFSCINLFLTTSC